MRSVIVMSFATMVLGLAACAAEDGGDDGQAATTLASTTATMSSTTADASESGDEASTSSGGAATTMPASTGPADTGADSGDTAPAEDTGASMTAGGDGSTSTGEMFDPCAPEPTDDDCNACTKASCCTQLHTCFDDPICECMAGCVMGAGDIQPCTEMCGQTGNFMPVTDCAASMCLFECIG